MCIKNKNLKFLKGDFTERPKIRCLRRKGYTTK